MTHDHRAPAAVHQAFRVGIALNLIFIVTEVVFGLRAGSLALLADAGHNLSDVLGLLLAWGATWLGARPPSSRRTYGFKRSTILAALINAVLLLLAVGGIAWEAVRRFREPAAVSGGMVMAVAAVGVVINGITALLFRHGRESDLNIRGAFLHMAADAAVSLGVVVAGGAIVLTGWLWLDPAVSLALAVIITWGTWGLLKDSVGLSLDAVPAGIDPDAVRSYLAGLPGVSAVHDLHVWGLSTTDAALTAHLVCPTPSVDDAMLARIAADLHERFGIEHPTIQVEHGTGEVACRLSPDDEV